MTERKPVLLAKKIVNGFSRGAVNYGPQIGRVSGAVTLLTGLALKSPIESGIGAGVFTISAGAAVLRNEIRKSRTRNSAV